MVSGGKSVLQLITVKQAVIQPTLDAFTQTTTEDFVHDSYDDWMRDYWDNRRV